MADLIKNQKRRIDRMLKRIITAIVALCVFVPIVIFSETWVFPAAVSLCAIIGIIEMLGCMGQKKNLFFTVPLSLVAASLRFV